MSAAENVQNLQIELQNELANVNQLLSLILIEMQKIKSLTSVGSEFETTIKQNSSLMAALANIKEIDFADLPTPLHRTPMDN